MKRNKTHTNTIQNAKNAFLMWERVITILCFPLDDAWKRRSVPHKRSPNGIPTELTDTCIYVETRRRTSGWYGKHVWLLLPLSKNAKCSFTEEECDEKKKIKYIFVNVCWLPWAITIQYILSGRRLLGISLHLNALIHGAHTGAYVWQMGYQKYSNASTFRCCSAEPSTQLVLEKSVNSSHSSADILLLVYPCLCVFFFFNCIAFLFYFLFCRQHAVL